MLINFIGLLWVDYAILGLISIFALLGLIRGAASELFALLCWLLAILIGLNFSKDLAVFFAHSLEQERQRVMLAILCLVALSLGIGGVSAMALGESLRIQGFSFFSRTFGCLLGAIRAIPVITLLVLLAGMTTLPYDAWWREARFLGLFQTLALSLRNNVSSGIAQFINYE